MKQKRFSLTTSYETYTWLKAKAQSNHRSLSGQTNSILDDLRKTEERNDKQEERKAA